jgi:hypothetical protein
VILLVKLDVSKMEFEIFYNIFAILIAVAGTIGNVLLLFIIFKEKSLRQKPSYHFILAISFVNIFWANFPLQLFLVSLEVFSKEF